MFSQVFHPSFPIKILSSFQEKNITEAKKILKIFQYLVKKSI